MSTASSQPRAVVSGTPVRVGIGMTLCDRATYLREAIESLLNQSFGDFRLTLVDDGSTDETESLARSYEQRDPRVRYFRFPERRGMVAAWRAAFERGSAEGEHYFAWASDHDRWHPQWLEALVEALDRAPAVVLAYPRTQRIDPSGMPLSKPARQFDTTGIANRRERWRLLNRSNAVAAGDMVYGLMRVAAVREAGVFREVLCPDRLLVAELTLQGQIRQVPRTLWYRRQFAAGSVERQRFTLFAPGTRAPSVITPPWYLHARSLWATYGDPSRHSPAMSRGEAARLVTAYTAAYAWRHYAKSSVQHGLLSMLGWPRWIYKHLKHTVLLGLYWALVASRRLGVTPLVERVRGRMTGGEEVRTRAAQPAPAVASRGDAALDGAPAKVLFIARHFTYFRNYESVIATLATRGHSLHLAAERQEDLGGQQMVERLSLQYPGVSHGRIPDRQDGWTTFVTKLRMTIDYLRYLEPDYAATPKLRARARARVPRLGFWLLSIGGAWSPAGRRVLRAVLHACERAVPRSIPIDEFLRGQDPDVVLLTPLIGVVVSPQLDYLRSAKALGYPTALCVWSWDHLSSKAILRDFPDRLFVWNETQRDEAVTLHGVPQERVVVTGAQCFDQWFDRRPSTDRATFYRRLGFPEDRAALLYVCSSLFQGSASEALFVQRWIRALRTSGLEPLASTPVLVRPHPARMKEWADVDLSTERAVAVWGRNPVDRDARADYFDSLFHCAAIVGLNTSAFLEGAIVGRPTFATLLPEHHENQEGTLHFHYLTNVGGGLLETSRSFGDQFEQLNAVLAGGEHESPRSRPFVEAFIRPHGLATAATPVFAREVEKLRSLKREPAAVPGAFSVLRIVLRPVAALMASEAAAPLVSSHHERVIAARHRAHRERVAQAWQVKDAHNAAEQREKEARLADRKRRKARKAAEWRRTKTMINLKRRIRKRIGFAL